MPFSLRIVQGCLQYSINGHNILLRENDCLMVNARQMHSGYSFHQQDCNFTCILFHTKLLTGNQSLYQKYISPVLENSDLEYLHFAAGTPCNLMLSEALDKILALKASGAAAYELSVISILNDIWKSLLQQSPIDFLNQYRLEVSCHLLKHTDLSITEIALNCGFLHLSYYSKMFCRCYGQTPSQYRQIHHAG